MIRGNIFCGCTGADSELVRAYLTAEFGRWKEALELMNIAQSRVQFPDPWPTARHAELLATLDRREDYVRVADQLLLWNPPPQPDVVGALGIMPNGRVAPDRLIEMARYSVDQAPGEVWRHRYLALAYFRAEQIARRSITWRRYPTATT